MTKVSFGNNLLVFGFGTKDELKSILNDYPTRDIFMDLTCYDPAEFYESFPQLKGTFSALFCDELKKIEIHFNDRNEIVIQKLRELGFTPIETSIISCGFIFPRTIVQIINEAYFALEENVAEKEDINRAMKFGVNYPKGPFEWAEGKEIFIYTLLNELYTKTLDKRYIASSLILKNIPKTQREPYAVP